MRGATLPPGCQLVVFDVDGTLYRQAPVRRAMLLALLRARGADGMGRFERIAALRRYRRLREEAADAPRGFGARLRARFCAETGMTPQQADALIQEWMVRRPLPFVARAVVPGARALFGALRAKGIGIGVWSDYPARAKLNAMGLQADHVVSAADPDLDALKPDPAGLARVAAAAGASPEETLMIGDRMDRDGTAAASFGAAFLLRGRAAPGGTASARDFTALAESLAA